MSIVAPDTKNVSLRLRIAAYTHAVPSSEELAGELDALERSIADERGAWVSFERRISELEASQGAPAETAFLDAASA